MPRRPQRRRSSPPPSPGKEDGAKRLGIQAIAIDEIETAYARMLRSDVKYRFVIDMALLPLDA